MCTALIYDNITYRSMRRETASIRVDPVTGLQAGAEPRDLPADGPRACLLLHGFTSSPADFGDLPAALHRQGFHVAVPLLPGHGRDPAALADCRWEDWVRASEEAYDRLASHHGSVDVVGFSMGAVLALRLAITREPRRLVLWGTFLEPSNRVLGFLPGRWVAAVAAPFVRYLRKPGGVPSINDTSQIGLFPSYAHFPTTSTLQLLALVRDVRPRCDRIVIPILFLHGVDDATASPAAAKHLYDTLPSSSKRFVWLKRSNHILGWDFDRQLAVAETVQFLDD